MITPCAPRPIIPMPGRPHRPHAHHQNMSHLRTTPSNRTTQHTNTQFITDNTLPFINLSWRFPYAFY